MALPSRGNEFFVAYPCAFCDDSNGKHLLLLRPLEGTAI